MNRKILSLFARPALPWRSLRATIALVYLVSMLGVAASANTINVPSTQYPTIQSGINAANPGDTVLVGDGTYRGTGNTNLDFGGTNITVKSVHGAAKTIIDCQGSLTNSSRGFYFHSNESSAATVNGFTITNGYNTVGGGIAISSSNPTITNCTFTNNSAAGGGGAIDASSSTLTVTNCTFTGNSVPSNGGIGAAGIYVYSSSTLTITGCTFTSNSGMDSNDVQIGALLTYGSTTIIHNCTFTGNKTKAGYPAGVFAASSTLAISNSSFVNNAPFGVGVNYASTATIQDTLFSGNTADALYTYGNMSATNCIFVGNVGTAAQFNDSGYTTSLTNCTFTGNSNIGGSGAAVQILGGATPTLTNCIFYGDKATKNNEIYIDNQSSVVVSHCDVQGGYNGTGNINAVPQFVNANSDLHLRSTSPCIGAGTSVGAPLTDYDGVMRPNPPSIGAYEVVRPTITSFSPASGPYGTKVTITGTNLLKVTGVQFGTTSATSFKVVSATTITASVPYGATTGNITVTTPGGSATSTTAFTVTSSPALTVKSLRFSPSTIAPGGQSTGTVTLSAAAPTGGATINILSGSFVFTTVTVPAGATSATFTVLASPYAPDGVYLFLATYNGSTASGTLTIHGG